MSDKNPKNRKKRMSNKTKSYITGAVFILAVLVLILCIMSGALTFEPGTPATPTPPPSVTAPLTTPTPTPPVTAPPVESEEPQTFMVTVFAGHGGSADPSGSTSVEEGDSFTVTFVPDPGYEVHTVTVNGELADPATSYTATDISADITIDVSFDLIEEPVTTPPVVSDPSGESGIPGVDPAPELPF